MTLRDQRASARRVVCVWVPDWPLVAAIAAGLAGPGQVVAICDARNVRAISAQAAAAGIRRGMRRRVAQAICPEVRFVLGDPARDVRAFEIVACAVEAEIPGVELVRPGLLLCPSSGASRYHGGDQQLLGHLRARLTQQTKMAISIGLADGILAAAIAAIAARQSGEIVPPGQSRAYLAPQPLRALLDALDDTVHAKDLHNLVDVLARLGIKTLGALADLPRRDVTTRFGAIGAWAWRLARAEDVGLARARRPERDFRAEFTPEDPLNDIDQIAFAARRLAEELHAQLVLHGLGYDRLRVQATTETGEQYDRTWRLEGIDVNGVTDRVRWQLEGWLTGKAGAAVPSGGIIHFALGAEEVHPAAGPDAERLWSDGGGDQTRAMRGAERLATMLGAVAVLSPVPQGGRDPRSRIRFIPWGEDRRPQFSLDQPWPGALPSPAPATIPRIPPLVDMVDSSGRPIGVSASLEMSAPPVRLTTANPAAVYAVDAWAGPWPVAERWWSPQRRRRVYLQVHLAATGPPRRLSGRAVLLACENSQWQVEGIYD